MNPNENDKKNKNTHQSQIDNNEVELNVAIVGFKAPRFSGLSWNGSTFKKINLSEYNGKYLIICFYSKNFISLTVDIINTFSEFYDELKNLGVDVVFVTTESKYSIKEFSSFKPEDGGIDLKYPIISDFNFEISQKYMVLDENGFACNSLFIINNTGKVKFCSKSTAFFNISELIRLIKAFQFSDKYSVVLQSKWQPGKKGVRIFKIDKSNI